MKFTNLTIINDQWHAKQISDADMAVAFFLFFHEKKYPNKKLQRALNESNDYRLLLHQFVFKKVRSKALTALKRWSSGEWNFVLEEKILTPYQVLAYQGQGIRPVTMKIQEQLNPILHREDCFEFFLHDLEHGYMMFFDQELKNMQIRFFNNLIESFKTDLWRPYLERADARFEYRLHYLISDMNTHIEHYRSYLNAMIDQADIPKFEFIFS